MTGDDRVVRRLGWTDPRKTFATDPGMQVADVALLGAEESLTLLRAGIGAPLVWPTATVLMRWVWRWGGAKAVAVISPDGEMAYGGCRRGRMRWRGS